MLEATSFFVLIFFSSHFPGFWRLVCRLPFFRRRRTR